MTDPAPMIAAEVGQLLEDEGLGSFGAAPATIFIDDVPRSPDSLLGVYTAAGRPPDAGLGYDMPHVQVIARGTLDPRVAYGAIRAVYSKLHGLAGVTLPLGTYLVSCLALSSEPARLGPDENGRHRYSITFELEVRSITEHRT